MNEIKSPEAKFRLGVTRRKNARRSFREGKVWDRDEVRDCVRFGGLDPACAKRWASIYRLPPFTDPTYKSRLGINALREARWPLTLATLWIAYGGDAEEVARQWVEFWIWHEGLFNAPSRSAQVMPLRDAEKALWNALKFGTVKAFSTVNGARVPIDPLAWDTLRWVNAGPAQVLGHDGLKGSFCSVVVDAVAIKGITNRLQFPILGEPVLIENNVVSQKEKEPKRTRGRPKGSGSFTESDVALLHELTGLLTSGKPRTVALNQIAMKALGPGTIESKAKRIERRLKKQSELK